jgi:hypothetical protein
MEFTSDGRFKVGDTTLKSPMRIRIPDYGHELPEIHATSPLSMPIYTSAANVVNWLERGIIVEFCNSKDAERLFFFLMEYNRFVKEENKKIESIDGQYRLALKAQKILYSEINYKSNVDEKEINGKVPFISTHYKGIRKDVPHDDANIRRNPFMRKNKKANGLNNDKEKNPVLTPGSVYAFDVFSTNPETLFIEPEDFPDIDLTSD